MAGKSKKGAALPGSVQGDPLLQRALLEADLKLGPQGVALRDLLGQARGDYIRTRRVNASNAAGIVAATQQAQPQVAGVYDQALSNVDAIRGGVGAGGDPQAAAYARRVGESKANALADLVSRGVQAKEGQVFAGNAARDEYLGTKAKVAQQLLDLAGQQGATATSIYGQLKDDQAQRGLTRRGQDITAQNNSNSTSQSERNSIRSSGIDPDTGKPIPGGRLDPHAKNGKSPWVSPEAHARARDAISGAASHVPDLLKDAQGDKKQVVQLLIDGIPAVKSKDGKTVLAPAVKPIPADFAQAAVNAASGGLTAADVKRLHRRGLKIKTLGVPVRKPAKQKSLPELLDGLGTAVQNIPPVTVG